MKERPILFSGPMVRALLAGTKTQTRRVAPVRELRIVSHPGDFVTWAVAFTKALRGVLGSHSGGKFSELQARKIIASQFNPYGQPGDRLWVRETFVQGWPYDAVTDRCLQFDDNGDELPKKTWYRADNPDLGWSGDDGWETAPPWKPSIHMPRAASRIMLEITDVRVERLQDISEADAIAEGLTQTASGSWLPGPCDHPEWAYHQLWDQINGAGSWDANPWVWAVSFQRLP